MKTVIEQQPDGQASIYEFFRDEALDHLVRIESDLTGLGEGPPDRSLLQAIFRSMHSLKGTAAALGLSAVAELVHGTEALLEGLLARRLHWSEEVASLMREVCCTLEAMIKHPGDPAVAGVHQGLLVSLAFLASEELDKSAVYAPSFQWEVLLGPLGADDDAVAARALFRDLPDLGVVQQESSPRPGWLRWVLTTSCTAEVLAQVLSMHVDASKLAVQAVSVVAGYPSPLRGEAGAPLTDASTIRLSIAHLKKIDMQFERLCEAQAHLGLLLEQDEMAHKVGIGASLQEVAQATKDLRQTLEASRRVRAAEVLKPFPLLVQNLAKKLDKDIVLTLMGCELEVDRFVMERISEALVHLLRNSCDHGIEPPERRVLLGKPAQGTLTLSLRSSGSDLQVEVKDDGAGLSREAILGRADKLGLLLPAPATDEAVWALVLAPGFSTAPAVTELSGRGVGLDVVRCAVEGLGGRLSIRSAEGQGTAFVIDVPLRMSSKSAGRKHRM
ncbi:MAG: chemotaxis protein CheA [Polaromonas sp.]|jgi:two-component system chemotaxis sensor kinase CheA